ncbi:hypothetical protein F183_A25300 [Bryobacterales bacterium F-183]|nr:hypothetical protein F183_A25300 [Bryobacterales bacterium F-183]
MVNTVPFRLGKYTCQQRLGGNFGEVYYATHAETGQNVLVKIMQPFGQPQMFRQRFLIEARVACQCVHPNLIQTYEAGEIDGQYALVMEIPQGETLRAAIDRGAYTNETDALSLILNLTHAIAFLHNFGIVHRDLKPENIIIGPDGVMKLFDFGVARLGETKLPADGDLTGTPIYMSPEQVRGEAASKQSDIYSYGVLLFHLLTRAYPYRLAGHEDLYNAIVSREPNFQPLYDRQLRATYLVDLIRACLQKDPAQRPPSFDWIERHLRESTGGIAGAPENTAAMLRAMALPPPVPSHGPKVFSSSRTPIAVPKPPPGKTLPPVRTSKFSGKTLLWGGIAVALLAVVTVGAVVALKPKAQQTPPPAAQQQQTQTSVPPPSQPQTSTSATAQMLAVPAGKALVGRDMELVQVAAFEIDQTEVSNASYLAFCSGTGRECPSGIKDLDPQLPVVNVSFEDATAYAQWAGKRLPTAIEWEKAARGENGQKFPWGEEPELERANVGSTGYLARVNARGNGASPYGVLNLIGNVWEWVNEPVKLTSGDVQRMQFLLIPPVQPGEPAYQIRGGSFMHVVSNSNLADLTWDFAPAPSRFKRNDIGFRCARSLN